MEDIKQLLQWPGRANCMEGLEQHLNSSARLARAVWEIASSEAFSTEDNRSREALIELALVASDHASAALYAFYLKDMESKA